MTTRQFVRACILASALLITHGGTQHVGAADPRTAPLQQQPVKLPPQTISVALNPSSVVGGATGVGTVTLNQVAPSGGVLVKFQTSNPAIAAVPPSVVVQPGATSATFVIQTYPVATNPNVVTNPPSADISAQVGNSAPKLTKLTVLPATLTSLSLNPTSVRGGTAVAGQIAINGPAPAGGFTVALSSSAPAPSQKPPLTASAIRQASPTTVPQHVTIPPGATSAAFQITTRAVAELTSVNISAANGPFNTKTTPLAILPVGLAAVSLPSVGMQGGATSTATVALSSGAPAGGVDVKLTVVRLPNTFTPACSPMPSAPAAVPIKEGETSATFPLTTFPVGINPNWFAVTAAWGSSTVAANFHVGQAKVASVALPASVKGGTTVQLLVALNGPMGQCPGNVSGGLGTITITTSNTVVAQAPPSVQVPGGATSAAVTITTSAVTQTTTVTVGAYHVWELDKKVATLTLTP